MADKGHWYFVTDPGCVQGRTTSAVEVPMAPNIVSETPLVRGRLRVAEYVRMSTDRQKKYSTANQATAVREYAFKHDMDVVRIFQGDGKNGLEIDGRRGLKRCWRYHDRTRRFLSNPRL
ncbi:recombinase family protein [Luteibacter sp. W1I16]|uniref:recombinase family protein n=1 Tax=Luteibacter sp. W1I16 TaxID=3373922 RepID=UPI003D21A57D